ncbi:MAG: mycofactocin system FadH/OYE family oxidoreductase 2, partial [Dehalococcoidia bacterium]
MTSPVAGGPAFPNLFSPLEIGRMTVRNRILSTAHYTGYGAGGLPSEQHKNYWASKARGGIGLIVTEVQPVHPSAGISERMIHCWRDEVVDAWAPVVEAVHAHGAKLVAQLWHPGRQGGGNEQYPSWAPSALPNPATGVTPHEMTADEVREVVASFGVAARNMQAAGLDGVELHGAHGYLIEQFLSPLTNRRTDEYGGSLEGRLRFAQEVIDTTREAVGTEY